MNILQNLQRKKKKLVVGLMSGTSADSIDAVLVEIQGFGTSTRLRQIAFTFFPYPKGYKEYLLKNSLPGNGSVDAISQLNILVAHFFADAVNMVAEKARVPLSKIDLIGSHGQTIHHLPSPQKLFGKSIRSTLQIGDPSTIAKLTGIVTVGDFRTGDMALGGQGAPLVPYFDYLIFRSPAKNRALLNIGGIANITVLPKNCSVDDVAAFDTGPGNMIIDALMKRFFKKKFDNDGMTARRGNILPLLLRAMMHHRYFAVKPPKSTGREMFGAMFIEKMMKQARGAQKKDLVATATEFTALTVYEQYARYLKKKLHGKPLDELIVSGGGTHNPVLMESLRRYFSPAAIMTSGDLGVSSDAKEALCFAVLANETIHEQPANIPSVTGAHHQTILGTICLP